MNILPSTEAICIDLIAMRNWHFQRSMDKTRPRELRRWHRSQVKAINSRLERCKPDSLTPIKIGLIEFLTTRYQKLAEERIQKLSCETPMMQEAALGFEWRQFCEEARAKAAKAGRGKL